MEVGLGVSVEIALLTFVQFLRAIFCYANVLFKCFFNVF